MFTFFLLYEGARGYYRFEFTAAFCPTLYSINVDIDADRNDADRNSKVVDGPGTRAIYDFAEQYYITAEVISRCFQIRIHLQNIYGEFRQFLEIYAI